MGFASLDDLINEVTVNGKFIRSDWNKLTHAVTAHVAGEWHALFHSTGNPTTGVLGAGTNKSFQSLDETVAGAIRHGGVVTPDTKHLLNALAVSAAATTMPAIAVLVDLLGYYPITTTTTTGDQATVHTDTVTFTNATDIMNHAAYDIADKTRVQFTTSGTLPAELSLATDYWTIRQSSTTSKLATSYANAVAGTAINLTTDGTATTTVTTFLPRSTTGAGVQAFLTPSTVMGAGTPNLRLTYTDSDANTGNLTPATLPIGKTASAVGHVSYSGTGAGKYGPFYPLAAGDKGIRSVQQYNQSATWTSGVQNVVLCKAIGSLPMTTVGVAAERDFLNQIPSLPKIEDGACLSWLIYAGAATPVSSSFYGHLDFGWG